MKQEVICPVESEAEHWNRWARELELTVTIGRHLGRGPKGPAILEQQIQECEDIDADTGGKGRRVGN